MPLLLKLRPLRKAYQNLVEHTSKPGLIMQPSFLGDLAKLIKMGSLLLTVTACGQTSHKPKSIPFGKASTDFTALMQRFRKKNYSSPLLPGTGPVIYRDSSSRSEDGRLQFQFEIRLAAQPLGLRHREVSLRGQGYPISYSVLYQEHLVAVFKNGKFGCFRTADFEHDEQLERQLNTKQWKRHWLIDRQLIGQSGQQYYVFDQAAREWRPYQRPVPFGERPKLYEDARYLAYADCNGEFGGTAYFFNKATQQTHRLSATCANSVWQENGQYRLLASMLMEFVRCVAVTDLERLKVVPAPKKAPIGWQLDSTRAEEKVVQVFDYMGLQLYGGFRWRNQTVYLAHWCGTAFLVTIANNSITIVDPLFADDLYTHDPITTSYSPDLALTNLDFYGLGGSDEVATLLWQGSQLTKIEWGEQPQELP